MDNPTDLNNRIRELEQELTQVKEAHIRLLDRMSKRLNELQELYENLLDPIEKYEKANPSTTP